MSHIHSDITTIWSQFKVWYISIYSWRESRYKNNKKVFLDRLVVGLSSTFMGKILCCFLCFIFFDLISFSWNSPLVSREVVPIGEDSSFRLSSDLKSVKITSLGSITTFKVFALKLETSSHTSNIHINHKP